MRIVIVGASGLGLALAREMLENQHDVVLVDQSREKLDSVSERLDCGFIEGDGTLPQILRDGILKPLGMPQFADITDEEIAAVLAHIMNEAWDGYMGRKDER